MRIASMRSMDVSNGPGIGVSLFVQGCPHKCFNCFNKETWDFNGGTEWTDELKEKFLSLLNKEYITRCTLLGGEPLAEENLDDILDLVKEIKYRYPNKKIWIYSGYTYEHIYISEKRLEIIKYCDILVEGRYIDELRDPKLKYKGSSNQNIIGIKESLVLDSKYFIFYDDNLNQYATVDITNYLNKDKEKE